MRVLGFWNNKGGTGKTSLTFQAVCAFASHGPTRESSLLTFVRRQISVNSCWGDKKTEEGTNSCHSTAERFRRSVGGYFQQRLPKPFDTSGIAPLGFLSYPCEFNAKVPENLQLLAGDPLLELQSNAISTLANTQIPGTDSWVAVASWLKDYIDASSEAFDYCFVDMNPSFSMYTQIALACCERLVLPVTADDSSRRGIQNALSLIFGIELPSEIYAQHNFHTRMTAGGMSLPRVHMIVKNRLTQYVRVAKGYAAVLQGISDDLSHIHSTNPDFFTFSDPNDGLIDVKDFQTSGVVAFARGTPFVTMNSGTLSVATQRVQVNKDQLEENRNTMDILASRLW